MPDKNDAVDHFAVLVIRHLFPGQVRGIQHVQAAVAVLRAPERAEWSHLLESVRVFFAAGRAGDDMHRGQGVQVRLARCRTVPHFAAVDWPHAFIGVFVTPNGDVDAILLQQRLQPEGTENPISD